MCAQNTTHTLLIRYSRGVRHDTYVASTNVLLVELTKLLVCATVMAATVPRNGTPLLSIYAKSLRGSKLTLVPAVLYFAQNVLAFVALQNLEAGVFSVLVQLKTLTTAVFSVVMLGKRLSPNQWRALCLVALAAILIENPSSCTQQQQATNKSSNAVGVGAVLAIAVLSGFTGVYFEKVLKTTESTLWERNFQLSTHSIVFAILSIALFDGRKVLADGFFAGYSLAAVLIVGTSALGGILVAVVMKYTDNIVKGFATAIAICLTSVLSIPLLGASLTSAFWVGALMVVLSIFNYADVTPVAAVQVQPAHTLPTTIKITQ
jgi:UDP-sugar transporter A1/2/3